MDNLFSDMGNPFARALPPGELIKYAPDQLFGTERWANEEIARFTYKHGWTFEVAPGGFFLQVCMEVEDTHHPGNTVKIGKWVPLSSMGVRLRDPALFARMLAATIQEMEIHESREWLRRDGQIYDNPHTNPQL